MDGHEGLEELKCVDCFVVSGSKVLEGYGGHVVIAISMKSFTGRIMMGILFLFFPNHALPATDDPFSISPSR